MSKLKAFLGDLCPRDWKTFAIGLFCIAIGVWNTRQRTVYNDVSAAIVYFAAGFSIWSSIWQPQFVELRQHFRDMEQNWKNFDPEANAKKAAEAFKNDILERQARGEFGSNVHITFSDLPPVGSIPPPGRLH